MGGMMVPHTSNKCDIMCDKRNRFRYVCGSFVNEQHSFKWKKSNATLSSTAPMVKVISISSNQHVQCSPQH